MTSVELIHPLKQPKGEGKSAGDSHQGSITAMHLERPYARARGNHTLHHDRAQPTARPSAT